jgi:hypothetical protein
MRCRQVSSVGEIDVGKAEHQSRIVAAALFCVSAAVPAAAQLPAKVHVNDRVEVTLTATGQYANPYTDVEVCVDLKGPGFAKRCHGF